MAVTKLGSDCFDGSKIRAGWYTHAMTQSQTASFAVEPQQVQPAAQWVENVARDLGLSGSDPMRLSVIAEELFANSLHHAEIEPGAEISLNLTRDGEHVRLDYVEPGQAFNPLEITVPETPNLESWPIGGLGLRLIHRFAERTGYERVGNANRLSVWLGGAGEA